MLRALILNLISLLCHQILGLRAPFLQALDEYEDVHNRIASDYLGSAIRALPLGVELKASGCTVDEGLQPDHDRKLLMVPLMIQHPTSSDSEPAQAMGKLQLSSKRTDISLPSSPIYYPYKYYSVRTAGVVHGSLTHTSMHLSLLNGRHVPSPV